MRQLDYLAVSRFQPHDDAEAGIETGEGSGTGCQAEQQVAGFDNPNTRIKHWGENGATWGAILGCLFGAAFFLISGPGAAWIQDALTASFIGGLGGAAAGGGLSILAAGLYSAERREDSVRDCGAALRPEGLLRLVDGTSEEIAVAQHVLQTETAATRTEALESEPTSPAWCRRARGYTEQETQGG